MKHIIILLCLAIFPSTGFAQKTPKYIGTWKIESITDTDPTDPFNRSKPGRIKKRTQAYISKHTGAVITIHEDMTVDYKLKEDTTIYHGTCKENYETARSMMAKRTTGSYAVNYTVLDIQIQESKELNLFAKIRYIKRKKRIMGLNDGNYFYTLVGI